MNNSPAQAPRLVKYPLYTVSDLSTGMYAVVPSILLMFYMTNTLGIPVGWATLASLLPKIVDLIAGPLIGAWSDRSNPRLGRRRAFILFGAATVMPSFLLLWSAPFLSPLLAAVFIGVAFSLCAVCYSCYIVPYSALNAEIVTGYHDSTSLNAYRATYSMSGALLAGAGAPWIVEYFGGGRPGYAAMGATMGCLMSLSILVTFLQSREPARPSATARADMRQLVAAVVHNRPYLLLLGTYLTHVTASGVAGAALAYFVTYQLHRDGEFLGLVFLLSFSASVVAIPAFSWIGRRLGKFSTYALATVMSGLMYTGYLLLDTSSSTLHVLTVAFLAGLAEGGIQVFAFAMLIDCVLHGNRRPQAVSTEAMLNGLFYACEKLGFATGAALAGGIFLLTGLVETTQGYVQQPDSALTGIRYAVALAPAVLNAVSLAIFLRYRHFDRENGARDSATAEVAATRAA